MEILCYNHENMGDFMPAATGGWAGWQHEQRVKKTKRHHPPPPQPPLKRNKRHHPPSPPPPSTQPQPDHPLKMVAESFSIPKVDKVYPHGDDASFISADNQSIGVADGVGGWRKFGIDSGEYARQLMSLIEKNHNYFNNNNNNDIKKSPKQVLEEAYSKTTAEGSSTACIVSFSGEDKVLRAANVGDSGFLVIRDGAVVYRSPKQQRSYNCPYQLGPTKDDPSVAVEIEFGGVIKGDLVLLGTDGVLDNVDEREMLEIVDRPSLKDDLREMCWCVAETAYFYSICGNVHTPYSIAAKRAGKKHEGGKIDDITVVIARVVEGNV